MSNPFIRNARNPNEKKKVCILQQITADKTPATAASMHQFLIKPDQDSQNTNINNVPSVAPASSAMFQLPQKSEPKKHIKPQVRKQPIPKSIHIDFEFTLDKVNCLERKTSNELRIIEQLNANNYTIQISKQQLKMIKQKMQPMPQIINCLTSLYKIIRGNNESILKAVQNCKRGKEHELSIRKDQVDRLHQGLCFYQPVKNTAIRILNDALNYHPFGKIIRAISQQYKLDLLKSFYVVRQIHIIKQAFTQDPTSFSVHIQPQNMVRQHEAISMAGSFLKKDKSDLLACYKNLLSRGRPSDKRLSTIKNEFNVLWANINAMAGQQSEIQQKVVEIYEIYWNISKREWREPGSQLDNMKNKMLNLNLAQNIRNRLQEIGIDQILKRQTIEERYLSGANLDLYHVLIKNSQSNFEGRLKSLEAITKLSDHWKNHIQNYLQNFQLKLDSQNNLLKSVYLYKLLLKWKNNNRQSIKKQLKERVVYEICNNCSFVIGLILAKDLKIEIMNISILKKIMLFNEVELSIQLQKQGQAIKKYIRNETCQELLKFEISLIKEIVMKYIKTDDLQTLELQISNGKVYYLNPGQENKIFQIIRYYCTILGKFIKMQSTIQRDIFQVLQALEKKGFKIDKSMDHFVSKIINCTTNIETIQQNIYQLFNVIKKDDRLCSFLSKWAQKLQNSPLTQQLNNFSKLICMIGQKIIQTDYKGYLQVYLSFIYLFDQMMIKSIVNLRQQIDYQNSIFRVFYVLSTVIEWSNLFYTKNEALGEIYAIMKTELRLFMNNPISLMTEYSTIESHIKLSIVCSLINEGESDMQAGEVEASDIAKYYKNVSLRYQFYNYVSNSLSSADYKSIIECYYIAAKHQNELLQLLYRQNFVNFKQIKQQRGYLNMLFLYKFTFIGDRIYFTIKEHQLSVKKVRFANLIAQKTIECLKNKTVPILIYQNMFCLMIKLMNAIQLPYHIFWLKRGFQQNLIEQIKIFNLQFFGQYVLYLLCLDLASKKNKLKITNPKERASLISSLNIFSSIIKLILKIVSQSKLDQEIYQLFQMYIRKLILFLQNCLKQNLISAIVKNILKDIKASLLHLFQNTAYNNKYFYQQEKMVSNLLNKDSFSENNIIMKELNQQQYTENINKALQIMVKRSKQNISKSIEEITKMIESHPKLKISILKISESIIKSQYGIKVLIQSLKLASLIINNTLCLNRHQTYEPFKFIFENYFQECQYNKKDQLASIIIAQNKITIMSVLIQCSHISAIVLLSINKNNLNKEALAMQIYLRTILTQWGTPDKHQVLETLNEIQFQLDFIPEQWQSKQRFTLWNFIQYREKLILISSITKLYRLLNGLVSIEAYDIVTLIANFLSFIPNNKSAFSQQSNLKKIDSLDKFMRVTNLENNNLLFSKKSFSLTELKQLCWQISQDFKYLGVQLQTRELKIFDRLIFIQN